MIRRVAHDCAHQGLAGLPEVIESWPKLSADLRAQVRAVTRPVFNRYDEMNRRRITLVALQAPGIFPSDTPCVRSPH